MAVPYQRLSALLARCNQPIYRERGDVLRTALALIALGGRHTDSAEAHFDAALLAPLRKFYRRDGQLAAAALQEADRLFSSTDPLAGGRLSLLCRALPFDVSSAETYHRCIDIVASNGLQTSSMWHLTDLLSILNLLRQRGEYDSAFVQLTDNYVLQRVPGASTEELGMLASIVATVPELRGRSVSIEAIAKQASVLADTLTPPCAGAICAAFNRLMYCHGPVALALQEEADRLAEQGDVCTCVQLLYFICRQDVQFIAADTFPWLVERVAGEALNADTVLLLCRSLVALPKTVRVQLTGCVSDILAILGEQVPLLLSMPLATGGLDGAASGDFAAFNILLPHFLHLKELAPPPVAGAALPPQESPYYAAVDSCADYLEQHMDAIMEADGPPLQHIPVLLAVRRPRTTAVGLAMLREAASQCTYLPALWTFQILLVLGDTPWEDPATFRYLRSQLAKTAAGIPPAQLCAALRSLRAGWRAVGAAAAATVRDGKLTDGYATAAAADEQREHLAFLRFCTEQVLSWFGQGIPLRLALTLVESLYDLGCRDEGLYAAAAAYVEVKQATASPAVHSVDTAQTVCLALGQDLLATYPKVHAFLLDVVARGVTGEAALTPTAWMNQHDSANRIAPVTEDQQQCLDLIEQMVATPASEHEELERLAAEYIGRLAHVRPDDHKYFFGVFEEKVLKSDLLLKECLDAITSSGAVGRLSAVTIAAMLHSLASLRFAYVRCVKQFLASISHEQWCEMDAVPLVQILGALSRLSLRQPSVLNVIAERLTALCLFLSPHDTAEAIRAFLSLGVSDATVQRTLVQRLSKCAGCIDEPALNMLFTAPNVHRVMRTTEVAAPLLLSAAARISSPHVRRRIARTLKMSALPRDFIESTVARLGIEVSVGPPRAEPLRLTQS